MCLFIDTGRRLQGKELPKTATEIKDTHCLFLMISI